MIIRNCNSEDAITLRNLAKKCKPLDVHTHYTYWVICHLFGESCFLLFDENKPIGYIASLIKDDVLFIWQIGILKEYRNKKYSRDLLNAVKDYALQKKCTKILVSISPENENSYCAFHRYCLHHELSIIRNGDITLKDPAESFFECENLYEIAINN